MKTLITNYVFDASAKTITFSDFGDISLEKILLVTNTTDNIIIYNFAESGLGGTVATNVLTLDYDTTSMSDTDDLQIFYELKRTPYNSFQENTGVVSTTETQIFTYTVPANTTLNIEGLLATGTATGRFYLKVEGTTVAVARTSASERDANRLFGQGVIQATAGETVTVTGYHEETANQTLSVSVFGYLT